MEKYSPNKPRRTVIVQWKTGFSVNDAATGFLIFKTKNLSKKDLNERL